MQHNFDHPIYGCQWNYIVMQLTHHSPETSFTGFKSLNTSPSSDMFAYHVLHDFLSLDYISPDPSSCHDQLPVLLPLKTAKSIGRSSGISRPTISHLIIQVTAIEVSSPSPRHYKNCLNKNNN